MADGRVLRSRLRGRVMDMLVREFAGCLDEVRVGAIIFGPCCVFVVCGVT